MKKICLVLSVMVAVLMLFSAAKVGAICDPNLPPGWCFEWNGYRIEIVDLGGNPIPLDGTFPVIDGGNSVFAYKFTRIDSSAKSVSHIDILIPACSPSLVDPKPISLCNGSSCIGSVYGPGLGDPSTGFGLGMTLENTFK